MGESVVILGATPLGTALGVALARANWPIAGIWDPEHSQALVASLRIGCCAFPTPEEPLKQAGWILVSQEVAARVGALGPGARTVCLWPEGGPHWLAPGRPVTDPGCTLQENTFRCGGEARTLVTALGLPLDPK